MNNKSFNKQKYQQKKTAKYVDKFNMYDNNNDSFQLNKSLNKKKRVYESDDDDNHTSNNNKCITLSSRKNRCEFDNDTVNIEEKNKSNKDLQQNKKNVFCNIFYYSSKGRSLFIVMIPYLDDCTNSTLLCSCKLISTFSAQIPFQGIVSIPYSFEKIKQEDHFKRISKLSISLKDVKCLSDPIILNTIAKMDKNQIKTIVLKVFDFSSTSNYRDGEILFHFLSMFTDSINQLQFEDIGIKADQFFRFLDILFSHVEFNKLKILKIDYKYGYFDEMTQQCCEMFFSSVAVQKMLMNLEILDIDSDISIKIHKSFITSLKIYAPYLTHLNLSKIEFDVVDLICYLKANNEIKYLDISHMRFDKFDQIKCLAETLALLPSLTYLDISWLSVCEHMQYSSYSSSERKCVSTYYSSFGHFVSELICIVINQIKSLKTLICDNNPMCNNYTLGNTIEGIAKSLSTNQNLTTVSLSGCLLGQSEFNILFQYLMKNSHLISLDVSCNIYGFLKTVNRSLLRRLLNNNLTIKYLYLDRNYSHITSTDEYKVEFLSKMKKVIDTRKKKCFITFFKNEQNVITSSQQ